jgi:hypothetical protein
VSNYEGGSQVQVPPRRSRGIWRQALGVGSLVNLRALSFNAAETDKERFARGAKPYVVGAPWFWASPLARQLEAIDVSADPHDLGVWRERFQALPRLARVYLRARPQDYGKIGYLFRFVLDRDGDQIRRSTHLSAREPDYEGPQLRLKGDAQRLRWRIWRWRKLPSNM